MADVTVAIRGGEVRIDERDVHKMGSYQWRAVRDYNGLRKAEARVGKNYVALHRLVAGVDGRKIVKTRDGNALNCTRDNLMVEAHEMTRDEIKGEIARLLALL